jgi:hypothetical protein
MRGADASSNKVTPMTPAYDKPAPPSLADGHKLPINRSFFLRQSLQVADRSFAIRTEPVHVQQTLAKQPHVRLLRVFCWSIIMDGSYILGVVLTILGGVALAVQSGVNATLGSTTGSKPFASAFSFAMGTAVCLIYLLIDTTGLKHQLPSAAGIACESQLLRRMQQAAATMQCSSPEHAAWLFLPWRGHCTYSSIFGCLYLVLKVCT